VAVRGRNAERANDGVRDAVEQINGPAKRAEKPVEGARNEKRDAFCFGEAEALGDKLTENNLEHCEKAKRKDERDAMRDDRGPRARYRLDKRREGVGEGPFAKVAEQKARDGDADLDAGDDAGEVGDEDFDDFGARVALLDELADAREAHGHEREFGGGEEGVEADEKENDEESENDHRGAAFTGDPCFARGGEAAW